MNLTFRVTEVTTRMEPQGYSRAVVYQIMDGEDEMDDGQWRWAAPTQDKLPAYAVGDEFEIFPKEGRGESLRGEPVYLQVGQLWWLSERKELVQIMGIDATEFTGPAVRARVLSEVGGKENLGDDVMLWGSVDGIKPGHGPIFIAHADQVEP